MGSNCSCVSHVTVLNPLWIILHLTPSVLVVCSVPWSKKEKSGRPWTALYVPAALSTLAQINLPPACHVPEPFPRLCYMAILTWFATFLQGANFPQLLWFNPYLSQFCGFSTKSSSCDHASSRGKSLPHRKKSSLSFTKYYLIHMLTYFINDNNINNVYNTLNKIKWD